MKYPLLLLLLGLISCGPDKEKADLLLYNARIYTVDDAFSTASSLAVRDGKFVAVGDWEELSARFEADSLVDAGGRTLVPGLIDAHCHFFGLGAKTFQVDLTGTGSFEEVLQRVTRFYETHKPDFIFGTGWDQNDWEQKDFPNKEELDRLFPQLAVVLERIDGHAMLVNQKALDLAGIRPDTPVEGGEIGKENGRLTGILIDKPMEHIWAVMPPPTPENTVKALKAAEKTCLDYGLTTVNDAGLGLADIALVDSLQKAGELRIRMYAMVSNTPENLDHFLEQGPLKTDRLNVRSFKVYADGALGSRGAALKAPYTDLPGHFGAMVTPVSAIESTAARIANSGFQMNTHAIGDSANAVVLRAYRKVLGNKPDRRWKIEHAQVVSPEDIPLFGEDIIPSIQPTHATSDMYWAEDRLGKDRVQHAYSYQSLLEQVGAVALGTDFPVEGVSPFHTFYAAVARKDLQGYPEGGFRAGEALNREDALRGMTRWAAWSNFEEGEKGSIEVGKLADFVILSDDILRVPERAIPGITAEAVYIAGEKVR